MTAFDISVGIDWSGARGQRQRGIAVAECDPDGICKLVPPRGGGCWSRLGVLDHLGERPPGTLVGIDFAFSLPWPAGGPLPETLEQPRNARELWRLVDERCRAEPHLYAGPAYRPYGGWLADFMFTKLTGQDLWRGAAYAADRLRRTETALKPRPNSVFKIVGARTVGPGSFSGMRLLSALDRDLGSRLAVWPFDAAGKWLTLVEIYPSHYYRLAGHRRSLDPATVDTVLAHFDARRSSDQPIASQDEADALVAAAALRQLARQPDAFRRPSGPGCEEGWIFGVPVPSPDP